MHSVGKYWKRNAIKMGTSAKSVITKQIKATQNPAKKKAKGIPG